MSPGGSYSLVLAADYRMPEVGRIDVALQSWRPKLAAIGVHHIVVYVSEVNDDRVFVTIGIRHREPVRDLLRSRVIFDWFDVAGVEEIPAVFAGETVEKVDLYDQSAKLEVAGTIVAVMARVEDVPGLLNQIHQQLDRLREVGIRKLWVYQAFDDSREVLMLHEIDNHDHARRWIDHPDEIAEWMVNAGDGPYPQPFVGSLAHMMAIESPG